MSMASMRLQILWAALARASGLSPERAPVVLREGRAHCGDRHSSSLRLELENDNCWRGLRDIYDQVEIRAISNK
jgi:hypothetical protein